jgi:hypothetical protein
VYRDNRGVNAVVGGTAHTATLAKKNSRGEWKPHIQREALDGPQGLVAGVPKQATSMEHKIGSPEFTSTTECLCIHDWISKSAEVLRG